MGDIIYHYGEERFGVNTRRSEIAKPAPIKSRRQQEIERLVRERRQLRKQWKKASEAEREGLMLSRGHQVSVGNLKKSRELAETSQKEGTHESTVL
ncbi:hypothetical protein DPEC_G00002950 [Dallia pectoralis]|uniref:Uncharacterized protein n=1 Tax=Dallia pectoralis TaxID=75939 RepID=A0ACC2HJW4_DALPE|nr:hypothetical protein DPEC_G00002950 [Dallia pectoralis]